MATHAESKSGQGVQGPAGPSPTDSGNKVLATPADGSSGVMAPRVIVAADLPTIGMAKGGTGVDLSASGAVNKFLAQDASHVISARAIVLGDLPAISIGGGVSYFSGQPVVPGRPGFTSSGAGWAGYTLYFKIAGRGLLATPATWKFSMCVGTAGLKLDKAGVKRTTLDSVTVLDTTNVTFGGGSSPWTIPTGGGTAGGGGYFSDTIALQLDSSHDYYITIHVDATASASAVIFGNSAATIYLGHNTNEINTGKGIGYVATDHYADSPIGATTQLWWVDQIVSV